MIFQPNKYHNSTNELWNPNQLCMIIIRARFEQEWYLSAICEKTIISEYESDIITRIIWIGNDIPIMDEKPHCNLVYVCLANR